MTHLDKSNATSLGGICDSGNMQATYAEQQLNPLSFEAFGYRLCASQPAPPSWQHLFGHAVTQYSTKAHPVALVLRTIITVTYSVGSTAHPERVDSRHHNSERQYLASGLG